VNENKINSFYKALDNYDSEQGKSLKYTRVVIFSPGGINSFKKKLRDFLIIYSVLIDLLKAE
jgi:hypothetical protein